MGININLDTLDKVRDILSTNRQAAVRVPTVGVFQNTYNDPEYDFDEVAGEDVELVLDSGIRFRAFGGDTRFSVTDHIRDLDHALDIVKAFAELGLIQPEHIHERNITTPIGY